jgi:hypothetical protein
MVGSRGLLAAAANGTTADWADTSNNASVSMSLVILNG